MLCKTLASSDVLSVPIFATFLAKCCPYGDWQLGIIRRRKDGRRIVCRVCI
jgi:hypothetical protein